MRAAVGAVGAVGVSGVIGVSAVGASFHLPKGFVANQIHQFPISIQSNFRLSP